MGVIEALHGEVGEIAGMRPKIYNYRTRC